MNELRRITVLKGRKKLYWSDDQLQLREFRWPRLKLSAFVSACVIGCLVVILGANHLLNDVLGLGYNRIKTLTQENSVLQQQLGDMTKRMASLERSVNVLGNQGNQLRLLVDLPAMDPAAIAAGTGGALDENIALGTTNRTGELLDATLKELQRLNSTMRVQQQSYSEMFQKYSFNKEYFAALPALKPMDGYYSSNGFGVRMHPVLGIFKTHEGLDIINDVGTPVYASGDGAVEMAGQSGGGYGIVVVLKHGFGYQTLYAHLSKVLVREGQRVHRGDLIAKSGRTGLVSGPHLHYEVRQNGVCKNPVDFFLDDVTAQQYRSLAALRDQH
jgi:murein DD-endopeptidase MepM/ murein hydrolase activator NlpD